MPGAEHGARIRLYHGIAAGNAAAAARQPACRIAAAYAQSKGYPPELLDPPRRSSADKKTSRQTIAMPDLEEAFDVESTIGLMDSHFGGVTLSLVRQGDKQTKVKLRFDKVYYPQQVLEYYRIVWAAVDKQIFLDQALD